MALPLSYSLRNLWVRRVTNLLTAGGMSLVVFVFAAVLMLSQGLKDTLVATGSPLNALALRRSAQTEVQSVITPEQAAVLQALPEVRLDDRGRPLAAPELLVLINAPKIAGGSGNLQVRGTYPWAPAIRQQVRLKAGRMFRPGTPEIVVGSAVAEGFKGAALGGNLRFARRDWPVVGVMQGGNTGFDSEIWGDVNHVQQAFRRQAYSSVLLALRDPAMFEPLARRLAGDPRLPLDYKREQQYYEEQSAAMADFLRVLGMVLTGIFGLGACVGAMITMYAAVANRIVEVGTLRALGFGRRDILLAFMAEALGLALAGGLIGLAGASTLQWLSISTVNWATFSELAFNFNLTGSIAAQSLLFAAIMGLAGGLLPAARAARLKIVDALRSG